MENILRELARLLPQLNKAVFSAPANKEQDCERITLCRRESQRGVLFQAEERHGKKAFHKNLSEEEILPYAEQGLNERLFRQLHLFTEDREIAFRISKKGKILRSEKKSDGAVPLASHNREKNYLIREGDPAPFLTELGIFTKEGKVVQSRYDKFRQINRFLEMLHHAFLSYEKDHVTVLDFGCGKSYLTFVVYYYFAVLKKMHVKIIGYDLKEDVVAHCNLLAKKYGYHGLSFVVADVTKDRLYEEEIDFVISLHACDVATDAALNYALEKKVPYIFSVPCCQHEIQNSIRQGKGDLDLLLEHGLFRERVSALLTDALRVKVLEREGYRVDVVEFVDFAHSPKNVMLRARRKNPCRRQGLDDLLALEEKYGFRQSLIHLRKDAP